MKYNYVIMATPINLYKYMYQDMVKLNNVKIYWDKEELINCLSYWKRCLAKLHLPYSIKKLLYFQASKYISFQDNRPICFIWHHHFITEIENGMVNYIKKYFPQSKHVYFFTDPMIVNNDSIENVRKAGIDTVAVFDPTMAQKYNIAYYPLVYPNVVSGKKKDCMKYDICFVGQDKGREKELKKIAELCRKNNIRSAFIVGKSEKTGLVQGVQRISGKIAYSEVVQIVEESNCILELAVEPYYTCSLRIQEAVVWNKKLITNNRNVDRMPCCKDSKWIHYFEKPEDIDWDFVKRNEAVDYHYNGEFSAKTWLEQIENIITADAANNLIH